MCPRPVRITTNGKIRSYVSFALEWFDQNEDTPIVFHTLPHGFLVPKEQNEPQPEAETVVTTEHQQQHQQRASTSRDVSTKSVTSTIPRLISVIEIIKREFLRNLAIHHSPRLAGLHQYTEIGCLEDLQQNPSAEASLPQRDEQASGEGLDDRAIEVVEALNGKNHVRKKRTPFMKITLSLNPIPALAEQGVSYQQPTNRKISKSAKSRAKKKVRKHPETEGPTHDSDGQKMSE